MKIHRQSTASARNELGEVIGRARYGNETTILMNKKNEAAAIVSIQFLKDAMKALGLEEEG